MAKVGHLQELNEKYYDQGLRIIALADEPESDVKDVLESKGARYWIAVDNDQTTLQRYAGEGSLPLPWYYLVDVEGRVHLFYYQYYQHTIVSMRYHMKLKFFVPTNSM